MLQPYRPVLSGLLALLLLVAAPLAGCAAPRLEGLVVPGALAVVAVIDKDDSRLEQTGIPGARVLVTLTGNGQTLVDTTTDSQGRFSIPTRGQQMARGTVRVVVTAEGYARLDKTTHLRSFNRSLYMTMLRAPGWRPEETTTPATTTTPAATPAAPPTADAGGAEPRAADTPRAASGAF